jgi:hypothetical protein
MEEGEAIEGNNYDAYLKNRMEDKSLARKATTESKTICRSGNLLFAYDSYQVFFTYKSSC